MKRHHIILLILIFMCALTAPYAARARAEVEAPQTEKLIQPKAQKAVEAKRERNHCGHVRPIRITGFTANPPFSWVEKGVGINGDLEVKGYSIDLFDKIAKKHGWRYKTQGYTSQADIITALNRGQVDIVVASYLMQDNSIDATPIYPGYFKNIFIVYFLAEKQHKFTAVEDLIGLRGVVRQEENIYNLLLNKKAVAKLDLQQVKTAETAFTMLLKNEADYIIGSPYSIEAELRRLKMVGKIVPARVALMAGSLFFIMSNASKCYAELKPILQQDLKEYTQTGVALDEVYDTLHKWGEMFRYDAGLSVETEPSNQN